MEGDHINRGTGEMNDKTKNCAINLDEGKDTSNQNFGPPFVCFSTSLLSICYRLQIFVIIDKCGNKILHNTCFGLSSCRGRFFHMFILKRYEKQNI